MNHKERLRKEAHKKYQNLSEEEKDKMWKKVWKRYKNLSGRPKQKLFKYMKNYYLAYKKGTLKSGWNLTLQVRSKIQDPSFGWWKHDQKQKLKHWTKDIDCFVAKIIFQLELLLLLSLSL